MLSKIISASVSGIEAYIVCVEVDTSNGLPSFTMTGYLSSQVREAGDRVRTAIKNVGYKLPAQKIVVNVSPANIRKSGSMLDLPIALGILANQQVISTEGLASMLVIGELSLDGSINAVNGVLSILLRAKEEGIATCIIPKENIREAALVPDLNVIAIDNIPSLVKFINTGEYDNKATHIAIEPQKYNIDFSEVFGQYMAKRAATIAVAGFHNLLLSGPPGSGKTLIANRIPTIMPSLSVEEILEITSIYSIAGLLDKNIGYMNNRPIRMPHHTSSRANILGGGVNPMPGEITLAHRGVLFLDELTLFPSGVLECLRQPMEEGYINIIRGEKSIRYPAKALWVGAMNPCKCGYYPDRSRCNCSTADIIRYHGKLSRPFMDRFDLMVYVDKPDYDSMKKSSSDITSEVLRQAVLKAIDIQRDRYKNTDIKYNSQLNYHDIGKYCLLDKECNNLLRHAYDKYDLSGRGYVKLIKVARTIADLEGCDNIDYSHISEALTYRSINGV